MLPAIISLFTIPFLFVACFLPDLPLSLGMTATSGVLMLLCIAAIIGQDRWSGRPVLPLLPMLSCLGFYWLIGSLLAYFSMNYNNHENHFSGYFGALGALFLAKNHCRRNIKWSSLVWLVIGLTCAFRMAEEVETFHGERDFTIMFFLFVIFYPKFTSWMQPALRFVFRMAMSIIIGHQLLAMDCLLKAMLAGLIPLVVIYSCREQMNALLLLSQRNFVLYDWFASIRHALPTPRRFFLAPMGWLMRHAIPLGIIVLSVSLLSYFGKASFSDGYAISGLRPLLQNLRIFPTQWYAALAMKDLYLFSDEVQLSRDIFGVPSAQEMIKRLRSPQDRFSSTTSMTYKGFWTGIPFTAKGNIIHLADPHRTLGDCLGIWLVRTKTGNKWLAGHVSPGSPADKAGLTQGYQLISINGEAVEELTYRDWYEAGTKLTLELVTPDGEPVSQELITSHKNAKDFYHSRGLGISPIKKGNAWYVGYVNPGSSADMEGITRGYRLIAVIGYSIDTETYLDAEEKYLNGEFSRTITLDMESPEGIPVTKELIASSRAEASDGPKYQFLETADGNAVGYLRVNDFLEDDLDEFKKASSNCKITRFIIDLRYNSSDYHFENESYDKLEGHASWFLGPRNFSELLLAKIPRQKYTNHKIRYHSNSKEWTKTHYDGSSEVVFLTSNHTCGAAENLIIALRPYIPTTVIGAAPTCGNRYATEKIEYSPKDIFGFESSTYFHLVTGTYQNSQGEEVPTTGIQPDIRLDEDFSVESGSADDPLLKAALEHLLVSQE